MKSIAQPAAFVFRLDGHSGVPVYRQLIDQVQAAIATGLLRPGDQLPTIRGVAVELVINPNTVSRAYREMELRGSLDTQQGTGTFVTEFMARAGAAGFTVGELLEALQEFGGAA